MNSYDPVPADLPQEESLVTIGMNYFVLPGKEQIFEDACDRVVQTMQGIDGHDESHLYRRLGGDDRVYLIVSRWESEAAFDAFVASDAFKKVTNWGRENILSGPPRHTTIAKGDPPRARPSSGSGCASSTISTWWRISRARPSARATRGARFSRVGWSQRAGAGRATGLPRRADLAGRQ